MAYELFMTNKKVNTACTVPGPSFCRYLFLLLFITTPVYNEKAIIYINFCSLGCEYGIGSGPQHLGIRILLKVGVLLDPDPQHRCYVYIQITAIYGCSK
jgi:hypothetical protein